MNTRPLYDPAPGFEKITVSVKGDLLSGKAFSFEYQGELYPIPPKAVRLGYTAILSLRLKESLLFLQLEFPQDWRELMMSSLPDKNGMVTYTIPVKQRTRV